ncbi:MAG: hypothetical protein IPM46_09705 [Flavobacteriales bacterium]|nr:hypothetical protein [Flavobacteriales bacterium]
MSNYNVIVLDQQLPNNGYASLINTNVLRDGDTYDANTTAFDPLVNNKARTLQGGAVGRITQQFATGLTVTSATPTNSASARPEARSLTAPRTRSSPEYDPNDLGFWPWVNYRSVEPELNFVKYKPKAPWQRWGIGFNGEYSRAIVLTTSSTSPWG